MVPDTSDAAWVEGRNPYKLPKPSPWWLKLLHDYDPKLVVMPSVRDYGYRLCRRDPGPGRQGLGPLATLHGHPDTIQMAQHGLMPIATLTTWAVRSDKVIRDLMARDLWAHGAKPTDANVIVNDLEYREELAARKAQRDQDAVLDAVSGEAFRSMQFQNGSAISLRGRAPQHSSRVHRERVMGRPVDRRADKSVISPASSGAPSPAPRITLT